VKPQGERKSKGFIFGLISHQKSDEGRRLGSLAGKKNDERMLNTDAMTHHSIDNYVSKIQDLKILKNLGSSIKSIKTQVFEKSKI
jgi:hypothetical protein